MKGEKKGTFRAFGLFFLFGFGFLINRSRTASDTSAREGRAGRCARRSNAWTSRHRCVPSRVCVCRGGFEISSTPFLLTRRMGCVCLAPVGQWLLGKLPSSRTTSTPPTIHTHTHTHTHTHMHTYTPHYLPPLLPSSPPPLLPSSPPPLCPALLLHQTCIVSGSLMWNCFSFKFPPGNVGRRKMLHLIMACYCCSFIRVFGFWAPGLPAQCWGQTRLFFPSAAAASPRSFTISDSPPELFLRRAHCNPAERFITSSLYDYATH